jgi:ethanolamine utilization protein EutA
MAELLFELVAGGPYSELTRELLLTDPLADAAELAQVEAIVFSGGVSEYVYQHEQSTYGDLGYSFGRAINHQLERRGLRSLLVPPAEGIRATVIGAGEYTIQVSGTTSYVSNPGALPVYGLQVVRPFLDDGRPVDQALRHALGRFDLDRYRSGLAFAIAYNGELSYQAIRNVAEGIHAVMQEAEPDGQPLFLIMDLDIARSLGGILKEELHLQRDLVAVDGIDVGDLDFVDVGRPIGIMEPLPVTVKSLLFPSESRER